MRFGEYTTFDLAFDPTLQTCFLIDNPDEFLPAFVQLVKGDLQPFESEAWYEELITRSRRLPRFSTYWDAVAADEVATIGSHIPIPLRLDVPGAGLLTFVLAGSNLVHDPRFHVVHYTPYGARTMRYCAEWAEVEGHL